ncbi:hypothetical protein F0562_009201 [Nyssa sinensis]|uniref:Uncharacterized protein n=1 Tax=Nyssa sinensis TaxID=561372 RepID=A0A5J4ZYG6_9ASTE|nr:hypothetical protein F0562_009201 [Nyssa sinensis]
MLSARVVATAGGLQLPWALAVDICRTSNATAPPRRRAEVHGHIKAIDKGNIEEVQEPTTVTGLTSASAGSIKGALGSSPDACLFRARAHVDGPGLALVELTATTRHSRSPDCERALVSDLENGGTGEGEEEGIKKEEGKGSNLSSRPSSFLRHDWGSALEI